MVTFRMVIMSSNVILLPFLIADQQLTPDGVLIIESALKIILLPGDFREG